MENLSRRSMLRIGGLMSGGLLLPWAGGKALALADPAAAADVALVTADFPASPDLIQYRQLMREHAAWRLNQAITKWYPRNRVETDQQLADAVREHGLRHKGVAAQIWSQPARTWGDVVARAEIAWSAAPKVRYYDGRPSDPEPELQTMADQPRAHVYLTTFSLAANAALIESVLTMAGGERYDPFHDFDRQWTAHRLAR